MQVKLETVKGNAEFNDVASAARWMEELQPAFADCNGESIDCDGEWTVENATAAMRAVLDEQE